jgi:hypothetical protein
VVQSKLRGEIDEFAWVIPIPALINASDISVWESNNERFFQEINEKTQPEILFLKKGSTEVHYIGCGGSYMSKDDTSDMGPGVEVWDRMEVGPYEAAILSADNASTLIDWLGENNYVFPEGGENAVNFYVRKNWYFIALKVTPGAGIIGNTGEYCLPAIDISFPADKPVYPMVLTSLIESIISKARDHDLPIHNV